jgi:enoyl-CoA hydratase
MTGVENDDVVLETRGRLGVIRLDRPRAINALTHPMVRTVRAALEGWRNDDVIATVAIVGEGGRGLCAGGDVVSLHRDVTAGDGSEAAAFWRDEYALNLAIAEYPKPFVAIQDGVVLGGGIGVSAHGSHRIVTERTRLGFPEVTIGFVPDVGATWLLPRAPGQAGLRIALTAETVGPGDAVFLGMSDCFVRGERIGDVLAALETRHPDDALAEFAEPVPDGILAEQAAWADHAFAAATIPEILRRLRDAGVEEAIALAAVLDAKSPTALAVTLESMRRARATSGLDVALGYEYRVSRWSSLHHDFREGVRAQLIDKDRQPRWEPASHHLVAAEDIASFFAIPPEGDLMLARSASLKGNQ